MLGVGDFRVTPGPFGATPGLCKPCRALALPFWIPSCFPRSWSAPGRAGMPKCCSTPVPSNVLVVSQLALAGLWGHLCHQRVVGLVRALPKAASPSPGHPSPACNPQIHLPRRHQKQIRGALCQCHLHFTPMVPPGADLPWLFYPCAGGQWLSGARCHLSEASQPCQHGQLCCSDFFGCFFPQSLLCLRAWMWWDPPGALQAALSWKRRMDDAARLCTNL